jgi:hypothetical protein
MKESNPISELDKFFSAYSPRERKLAECYPEYNRAVEAGDIVSAMEIASMILTTNVGIPKLQALFRKRFPNYSGSN